MDLQSVDAALVVLLTMSPRLDSWKAKQVGMLVMMSVRGGMLWDWKVYVGRGVKGNERWKSRKLLLGIGVGEGGGPVCCSLSCTTAFLKSHMYTKKNDIQYHFL